MRRLVIALAAALTILGASAMAGSAGGPPKVGDALPPHHDRDVCAAPGPGVAQCAAKVLTDANGAAPLATTSYTNGYGAGALQTAYGVVTASPAPGTGPTVAIVDAYDNPNAEADLAAYRAQFGLGSCPSSNGCFTKVNQTGGSAMPAGNTGWGQEIDLDIEMVSAICPNCKILLVEATTNSFANLLAAEDYATSSSHAGYVSNSWGGNEFSSETSSTYDGHFNRPGIPITVSSGDSGYGVEYPAASRYVTAVGGTSLTLNANNTRATETAWSGAGSGCSAYESKPAWQTDTGCTRRTVADVAAVADPNTGVAVYDSYGSTGGNNWYVFGGTSVASPIVASVYALAGNGSSTNAGSFPYSHTASSLFDVTSGSNGRCTIGGKGKPGSTSSTAYLCTAGPGYDGPTGLGSPIGASGF